MLASAMSSSRSGARLHHSESRCESTSASSAEHQAVRRQRRAGSTPSGHGRVDAGERVLEVGAERPVGRVGAEQAVVDAAVLVVRVGRAWSVRLGHCGAHMCGTLSGIS